MKPEIKEKIVLAKLKSKLWLRVVPYVLFFLSIAMSSLIILPYIMGHVTYIIGIESPRILEINGYVINRERKITNGKEKPVIGCSLEVGGYKVYSDENGKFQLKFLTKSYTDIPIVIKTRNEEVIKRVSFRGNEFKKTEVFILSEN